MRIYIEGGKTWNIQQKSYEDVQEERYGDFYKRISIRRYIQEER